MFGIPYMKRLLNGSVLAAFYAQDMQPDRLSFQAEPESMSEGAVRKLGEHQTPCLRLLVLRSRDLDHLTALHDLEKNDNESHQSRCTESLRALKMLQMVMDL
jgi:hypothetical protein